MPSYSKGPALFVLRPTTPAERVVSDHMESQDHKVLIKFLRSDKEITVDLRLYLADVLEQLAYPRRGAPKKSIQGKYEYLLKKKADVAAVVANEIVRRWRTAGCKNRCPNGKPINRAASQEAIAALKAWSPKEFSITDAGRVEQRMKDVAEYKFPLLWDHLVRLRGAK
jgi:hypothetical protein